MKQPLAPATKSTLFEAIELINSGRIQEAESICRAAVERNEHDVNMTALLGATLFKGGKNQEAEKYLRISTQLAPNFAKPWSDLGALLVETRRPKEAIEVLENAVRLDDDEGDAWFNLGKARALLGLGPEADEAFEKSFELNPERKALAHAAEHQRRGGWMKRRNVPRHPARIRKTSMPKVAKHPGQATGMQRQRGCSGRAAYAPGLREAHRAGPR
jgi:tetratricopeptide (TPR) repeat protein